MDVYVWNEIRSWNALDQEVEVLGAVHIDFFVKWAWFKSSFKGQGIYIWFQSVVQSLEVKLELGGIPYREAFLEWDLTQVWWD